MPASGTRHFQIEKDDRFNLDNKTCSIPNCNHKAHGVWEWAPAHFGGYRCACHLREIWQETLQNVQESLAGLPERCDG